MLYPVQIRRHQVCAKLWRNTINRPNLRVLFVRPEDQTVTLLSYVPTFLGITDDRQFGPARCGPVADRLDGVRHQILVQHRDRRDVDPHHMTDFPTPGAGGIDDMGGLHIPPGCFDQPMCILSPDACHRAIAPDHRPAAACDFGHRIGGQGGVNMAIIRLVDAAQQPIQPGQRVQFGNPVGRQDFQRVAGELGQPCHMAEFVHPVGVAGDAHRARRMKAAVPPGFVWQNIPVEPHRSGAQFLNGWVMRKMRAQPGRMPGRTVGQIVLFHQQHIRPARLDQMVHQRHAHRAASDNQNLCLCHARILSPFGSNGGLRNGLAG